MTARQCILLKTDSCSQEEKNNENDCKILLSVLRYYSSLANIWCSTILLNTMWQKDQKLNTHPDILENLREIIK